MSIACIRVCSLLLLCLLGIEGTTQSLKIWEGTSMTRKQKRSELTVYLPEEEKSTGISVILCPGGSYCYLGMNGEGHDVAKWLQSRGFAAFVLRYRVGMYGNRHPAMIQDLQRTIQLVRERYAEYRIDPGKVGVMGFSAGGHLGGIAGIFYSENFLMPLGIRPTVSLRPDFVAMIYPVVSMADSIVHRKSRRNLLGRGYVPELAHQMSLEQNVHAGMPPVFIVACRDDRTVNPRNSEVMAVALKSNNIESEVLFYQTGDHGFGIFPPKGADSQEWPTAFEIWIKGIIAGLKK